MYRVYDIDIDVDRGCLIRQGEERHLRRRSFQVLAYLVVNHNRLVSKEELFTALWPDTAVTDDVLVQCIKDIRRALKDDPHHPRFIKTVPRSGYRFIGPVDESGFVPEYTEEITRVEFEIEEEIDQVPVQRAATTLSPGSRNPRRILTAVGASLLIISTAGVIYFGLPQTASRADIKLPKIEGRQPVAVMFFENTSGDKELDWLREGLADMLITNLSRSERLTVLSRQQLAAMLERTGSNTSQATIGFDAALEIAGRSGAEAVVSGGFARFGEKVRIEVQVHDTATGSLKAAESLTVERLDDILSQIDILSLKIARGLNADAPAPDLGLASSMTDDLEAYRYYSLGVAKAHALENKEAVDLLSSAVRLDPEFAMAHARIGYAYAVTWGLPDEGKPHLEKAFSLSSRTTARDRQNIAAWYAIANRDYPAAIQTYREIIRQYPLETEGYWRLARLLSGEGHTDEAIDVARQGLAADPESKDLYNILGSLLSSVGKHQEAIAAHQRYLALAPSEPNSSDSLGLTYQWAGDRDRALENFSRALEINPKFEIAMIHLAYCQIRRGEYRAAMGTLGRYQSLDLKPSERSRAFDAMSYIYFQLGNFEAAENAATRHHALSPNGPPWAAYAIAIQRKNIDRAKKLESDVTALWNLSERGSRGSPRFLLYFKGMVALNNGGDEEALGHFRDALGHRPPTWHFEDFEDCLGRAYLKLGRYDEAIAEFERILSLSPNYPRARLQIARALRAKNLTDEARHSYQQFLAEWKYADANIPDVVEARSF